MKKEDQIFLASVQDKMDQCAGQYRTICTAFMDMRQRALAEQFCRSHGQSGIRAAFYGGFAEAERTVLLFFPDYVQLSGNVCDHFAENPEECPLTVLRIRQNGYRELSHRDYLGSLLALGVKREICGDILVHPKGCDMIVLEDMAEFILLNYQKAGRTALAVERVPVSSLSVPETQAEELRDTVASLRLDNLIAAGFSLSRGKAAEQIQGGSVFVNGMQVVKPDAAVSEGDKLVLRGRGKVLLNAVGGETRKGRIAVLLNKYL